MPQKCIFFYLIGAVFFHQSAYSQITIAAAADMQFALEEVKTEFTKETGIAVKTVFGSTGKLAAQIQNGAPFDVFIAASMAEPESLFAKGYAVTKPKICTYGVLVVWTMKNYNMSTGLSILCNQSINKIAIPDPTHAPYGRAAKAALQNKNLYDSLAKKLVMGDNITITAGYIVTGNADIGFNAKSIVTSPQLKGKGAWAEVDSTLYPPIAQGIVLLKYGEENNPESSKKFYPYIFSEKARTIFARYGFLLP
jgi:molybdate transport system substrate-binding protein